MKNVGDLSESRNTLENQEQENDILCKVEATSNRVWNEVKGALVQNRGAKSHDDRVVANRRGEFALAVAASERIARARVLETLKLASDHPDRMRAQRLYLALGALV